MDFLRQRAVEENVLDEFQKQKVTCGARVRLFCRKTQRVVPFFSFVLCFMARCSSDLKAPEDLPLAPSLLSNRGADLDSEYLYNIAIVQQQHFS